MDLWASRFSMGSRSNKNDPLEVKNLEEAPAE